MFLFFSAIEAAKLFGNIAGGRRLGGDDTVNSRIFDRLSAGSVGDLELACESRLMPYAPLLRRSAVDAPAGNDQRKAVMTL
jgi:hypothetical protein